MADENDTPTKFAHVTREQAAIARLKNRVSQIAQAADQSKSGKPAQLYLPGFSDIGAMPNHLNRSSLIAPIARGKRKFHRQAVMVSRSDCTLQYTGEQLDEADGDLLMALIAFARANTLGEPVPLVRGAILAKLKRSTGNKDYEWLDRRLRALTEATLFLEAKSPDGSIKWSVGKTLAFRIIKEFSYDDETHTYSYVMDPRWVQLFSNNEYALVDWDKRMAISRGQDMAKTLQRLVATSSTPVQRYGLGALKAQMEYAGRMRDFREALTRSVAELVRVGVLAKGLIEDSTRGNEQLVLTLAKNNQPGPAEDQ